MEFEKPEVSHGLVPRDDCTVVMTIRKIIRKIDWVALILLQQPAIHVFTVLYRNLEVNSARECHTYVFPGPPDPRE